MEQERGADATDVFTALVKDGRPLPVVLHERDGHTLFVRELDSGELLQPIRFTPEVDRVVLMQPVAATALHFGPDAGTDDALTHPIRVVPDGRDGSTVFMRTLRFEEVDDGRRVHLKPGESPAFRAGSMTIELDALDAEFSRYGDGYAPVTNTIWSWFMIVPGERDPARVRHVLAAARRLDAAAATWSRTKERWAKLIEAGPGSSGPQTRAIVFELHADVELVIIALRRVVQMVEQAGGWSDEEIAMPDAVVRLAPHLKAIRDAFEHIDERAVGTVHGRADASALSIFDQSRLLRDRVIVYDDHEISADEVEDLLTTCRQFFKDIARSY